MFFTKMEPQYSISTTIIFICNNFVGFYGYSFSTKRYEICLYIVCSRRSDDVSRGDSEGILIYISLGFLFPSLLLFFPAL